MKITFIAPQEKNITKSYMPPLGILYVAAMAEQRGHFVSVIDANAEGLNVRAIMQRITELQPDIVGISSTTENRFEAVEVIKEIKKIDSGILTVWGGPHVSLVGYEIMQAVPEVDIVVIGEGDYTIVELLDTISRKRWLNNVRGIIYREEKRIIMTRQRDFISNLDALPLPARHLVDKRYYNAILEGTNNIKAYGVISSRGCPHNCIFCANQALAERHVRFRSPQKFVDELEKTKKEEGICGFDIWDDTLVIDRNHIKTICQEIIKRNLDIVWYARARVSSVDKSLLRLMKEAGCIALGFGVESGSERMLEVMRKHITLTQIRNAVKSAADIGIRARCFFIFSLPSETITDVKATLSLMGELSDYSPLISYTYEFAKIYPRTELESIAIRKGVLKDGFSWSRYQVFPQSIRYGINPTIPLFENKSLPIKKIKLLVIKHRYNGLRLLKNGIRGIMDKQTFKRGLRNFWLLLQNYKARCLNIF